MTAVHPPLKESNEKHTDYLLAARQRSAPGQTKNNPSPAQGGKQVSNLVVDFSRIADRIADLLA